MAWAERVKGGAAEVGSQHHSKSWEATLHGENEAQQGKGMYPVTLERCGSVCMGWQHACLHLLQALHASCFYRVAGIGNWYHLPWIGVLHCSHD